MSEPEFSREEVRRIAHDLNNALATVTGYAQLLEGQPEFPPHLARQLQTLAHDASRAADLSAQLLHLARAEGASNVVGGLRAPDLDVPSEFPFAPSAIESFNGNGTHSHPVGSYGTSGGGAEILVVDDEEPIITLISEVLAMDGHTITPAFNGAEALAWTQIKNFDLIISDVRMPAVGGPAFYEILQNERPDLLRRVLFVTGDTVSLSTRHFLAGTQRPVLPKPFDPERLRELVRTHLALA